MKNNLFALMAATAVMLAGCGTEAPDSAGPATDAAGGNPIRLASVADGKSIRLAYVTNGIDPFWTIAAAGVKAGAKDLGVECEVLMPPKGLVDQKRMIEGVLSNGVDGIAISPIDAANQVEFINQAAALTNVITQDSDAPGSNRLCFIGMDNYKAGRQAGVLIKEVLPEGGKVMIFVGRLEQLNAQQRRQGVIDELLDRPVQSGTEVRFDLAAAKLVNARYEIVGTRTDNFDYAKAKSNAEDAIATFGDLRCMVGLFAYNVPNCLAAVKEAGKTGTIKIVSFDEADDTLQGIIDGHVHGTVSQQPYQYGYQSVRVLTALAKGDKSVIPKGGFLEVESVVVRKDNVEDFWAKLKILRAE